MTLKPMMAITLGSHTRSNNMALHNVCIHVIMLAFCLSFLNSGFATNFRLGGNETDRLSLLALKAGIVEGPLQAMSNWNESIHFCNWQGVTCGRRHKRVTALDLQSQKLAGFISPHVGNLSFLRELSLQNNSFSGAVPAEIGRLGRLQFLRLNNNSFGGQIPANISGCSNLIFLSCSNNRLEGNFPMQLGSLSQMRDLRVRHNNLTGSISPFGNFSLLEILYATENNFDGSIPDALGRLANLERIMLAENRLSGTIPPSIFNSSSITTIDVANNQIEGSLPKDLGITLPNLQFLSIAINHFTGSIPASISNASNLHDLYMLENKLTGKVPNMEKLHELEWLNIGYNNLGSGEANGLSFLSSMSNATNLQLLAVNSNNFGQMLPESIGDLSSKLQVLLLYDNNLYGSIPTSIGNFLNLQRLSLLGNNFTGTIPVDIGKLQNLQELDLMGNKLSGNVPPFLGNMSLLTKLNLGGNNLQGSIPPSLGKCKNLIMLDLSRNNLTGTIPREVIGISSLSTYLDLSQNHLSGSLPEEVGKLVNLGNLDVSNNMLSGEIPATVASCVRLETINMGGNFFKGIIPDSLRDLRGIQELDLSRNNLSGEIPEFLQDLKLLKYLNLSFNDFEGVVPREGIFKNVSATLVMGNNKLCGGVPELQLPKCDYRGSKKKISPLTLKLAVSISCGLLGLFLMVCFLYCWFRQTKQSTSSGSGENSLLKVSYQSLLKATNGFSSANLLGVGSFGSVYKGILNQDGTIIAVKVLNLLRQGASKSFVAECEALRNIRHRNLVKVLTACSGVDYQGNDFKALVYEYMTNGSLEEWLHQNPMDDSSIEQPRKLSLLQRLNISIDVACALDYLHHDSQTPIVHCDLKPSNVLLDNEMTARVGDFGLARFIHEATHDSSVHLSSAGVRGSIGYAAPEYGMGSEVSINGDVYSFGILLLELFTGKRPTDDMFKDGLNLHDFTKVALPDRVAEIADPVLLLEREEDNANSTNGTHYHGRRRSQRSQECLISIMKIGVACSTELPTERMSSSDVAAQLRSIRGILTSERDGETF